MKTLEQIQEENRKLIIMANHPEIKSYEEALEKDQESILEKASNFGFHYAKQYAAEQETTYLTPDDYYLHLTDTTDEYVQELMNKALSCFYRPLTLDSVLVALSGKHYGLDFSEDEPMNMMIYSNPYDEFSYWDLKKLTLEEQSESTQKTINKLLTNKNNQHNRI